MSEAEAEKPHFSSNTACAKAFTTLAQSDPLAAVKMVLARGFAITRVDVPTPQRQNLHSIPVYDLKCRAQFRRLYGPQIAREEKALQLADQGELHPNAERDLWIEERVEALEREHHAGLRQAWRAQAHTEWESRVASEVEDAGKGTAA